MLAGEATYCAIDFESAGTTRGSTDAPVQIGLALLRGGKVEPVLRSYIHTEQPVVWSAQKVHGIRNEDLAGAPSMVKLWPEVSTALRGRVVVAHGSGTEKRFLRSFPLHGFGPWADTLTIGRAAFPDAPSHSLESLTRALGLVPEAESLCPGLSFHDALYDAVASLLLLREIMNQAQLASAPLDALIRPELGIYYAKRSRL